MKFNYYRINYGLLGAVIIIRLIEVIVSINAINYGATEIGLIAQFDFTAANIIFGFSVICFIYLNIKWKKNKKDMKCLAISILFFIIVLLGITFWDMVQLRNAIYYYNRGYRF